MYAGYYDTYKGENVMLKRFEVENFKGFDERLVFDLTACNYEFTSQIVKDGIVNKAIIYGKNGIGKSSLGIAIFDIISHLTDKNKVPSVYLRNYRNLNSSGKFVSFKYYFQFDSDEVIYEYAKTDQDNLVFEKLTINTVTMIDYNYFEKENNYIHDSLPDLSERLTDNKLSIVKYIHRSIPTNQNVPLTKMISFCENMLWYRSLSDGKAYAGFTNGGADYSNVIYSYGKLKEFQDFLKSNDLLYDLGFEDENGTPVLYAYFNNRKNKTSFFTLASTGTLALSLFFVWKVLAFDEASLVFIDEFDAFLHYESAETIVRLLNNSTNFQTMLTTHNTYLMQNQLTRPDCCYIMTKNKITSLQKSTQKEIREAHNLEKMYVNGAFAE